MNNKTILIIGIITICKLHAVSQVGSSPYSFFGQGQIKNSVLGINHGLGGSGIALSSENGLNSLNPASYQGLKKEQFIFEIAFSGKHTQFVTQNNRNSEFDANLSNIALGFRINNWWSASAGIQQYSNINYEIDSKGFLPGEESEFDIKYTGEGAINQFYFAHSFNIHNFSIGIKPSVLWGNAKYSEYADIEDLELYTIDEEYTLINTYIDYGVQYQIPFKNSLLTLGATLGNENTLRTNSNIRLYNQLDSTSYEIDERSFLIPLSYGFGMSYKLKNNWLFISDFEFRKWKDKTYNSDILTTRNSYRYSAGIEFSPSYKPRDIYFKKIKYRIGGFYKENYLIVEETPINTYALTFGLGMPLKRNASRINISGEIGVNGTTKNNLLKEEYFLFHINISLQDRWFQKSKYN